MADAAVAGPDGFVRGRVGMRHEHARLGVAVGKDQIIGQAGAIRVADALLGNDELRLPVELSDPELAKSGERIVDVEAGELFCRIAGEREIGNREVYGRRLARVQATM